MARRSAGVLLYKQMANTLLVLLVHPGGPFWRRRDLGAWSIPKREYEAVEEPEIAARREFMEETGYAPQGVLHPLGELRQRSGKIVTAFATAGVFDATALFSNTFDMEWPPGSGRIQSFPEAWCVTVSRSASGLTAHSTHEVCSPFKSSIIPGCVPGIFVGTLGPIM